MTRKTPEKSGNRPRRSARGYIKFLLIAVILMFAVDTLFWEGERPYVKKLKEQYYKEKQQEQQDIESLLPPVVIYPEDGSEYFESPSESEDKSMLPEKKLNLNKKASEKAPLLEKKAKGLSKDKISIVIDDVGMNIVESNRAIDLPSEVTLAFLPYAKTVRELSVKAIGEGHEIIIHAPMEAMSSQVPLGPMALRTDMDFATFDKEFSKIAASFDGYAGVNNHMGSRLTQDTEAMGYLMDQLKQRGLYFLDSRTISTSIAADMARSYGVPYAERDVFLDHGETVEFTASALAELEQVARRNGRAIAIGHPKKITIDALNKWIPTLEEKGFELVELSELLKKPDPNFKLAMDSQKKNSVEEQVSNISPAAGINYGLPPEDFYVPQIEVMNESPFELRSTPLQ